MTIRPRQFGKILLIALSGDEAYKKQLKIVRILIDLGGVYVKFAQLMLVRLSDKRGVRQYDYRFLLKRTYDATPIEPIDVHAVLSAELGNYHAHLVNISEQPVASGSFGQVYRAQLVDGQSVVIKVLKPSVARNLRQDLRLLRVLVWCLSSSSRQAVDIKDLFHQLQSAVLAEIDYRAEVFNATELYNEYKDSQSLVIPRTYETLSSDHVIVQEYIEGVSLTEVLEQKSHGRDASEYIRNTLGSDLSLQMAIVGQEMLSAMLLGKVAHGDPHPGNILLLKDNRVALIDFGICTSGPADKKAFFDLIREYRSIYVDDTFNIERFTLAVTNLFVTDLMNAIRSLDYYRAGQLSEQVTLAIQDGVRHMYAGAAKDTEVLIKNHKFMQLFDSVINKDNRFGLSMQIDQPAFLRATLIFIAVVESLEIKEEVLSATYGSVCDVFANYDFRSLAEVRSQEDAVAYIAQWLEQIASRDIFLYNLLTARIGRGVLYV